MTGGVLTTRKSGVRASWACAALCALLALGSSATAADAATRYVATSGSDAANDCLVQVVPCATIQHAIDEATPGDTVEVAAGTYAENLTVAKAIALRGPNAGIDPNTGPRVPEATIDGGSLISIFTMAPGISIDGFTVTGASNGFPIYTEGSDITGFTVANNVLSNGVRALTVATAGSDIDILNNEIDGDLYGIHFGSAAYENVRIEENVVEPATTNGIFFSGEGSIEGFEMAGNTVRGVSNVAANISEGVVTGNVFDVDKPGSYNLQISLHDSLLADNRFDGNGTTACLQIFGSQFGLVPSKELEVTANSFEDCNVHGIQLGPEIEEITITGNTIEGARQGINTRTTEPWDVTGKQISIFANRIVGSTEAGIVNDVSGILDARNNWWGCNGGLGTPGCAAGDDGALTTPQLVLGGEAAAAIGPGASTLVTARLDRNSAGETVPGIPDGVPVDFSSALGSFSPPSEALASGIASSTFTAGQQGGAAGVAVELDGQQVALPLTIAAPPAEPAPNPPLPPIEEPAIEVPNGGKPKFVPRGGSFVIATVQCPAESCTLRVRPPTVKIGGKAFKVRAKFDKRLGPEDSGRIRIVLTKAARQALAKAGKGRARVAITVTTSDGAVETVTIKLKLKGS